MSLAAGEREQHLVRLSLGRAVPLAVGACLFALARLDGGYGFTTWSTAAVFVWWAVALAVALGLAAPPALARRALLPGAALALFCVWTGLSIHWSASAEAAYRELDRSVFYLGVFTLGAILPRPRTIGLWRDGMALAIGAIGVVSLVSRLFPGSFGSDAGQTILPSLVARLSYPLGYWNGLGILLGLGVPLLLSVAVESRLPPVRWAAVASISPLAAALYLTSSRGAVATALVGAVVLLLVGPRRWAVLGATCVSAAGAAVSVVVASGRSAVVTGTVSAPGMLGQGHSTAVVVALAGALAGLIWVGAGRLAPRLQAPPRSLGIALVAAVVFAGIVAVAAAHPVARFDAFRRPPGAAAHHSRSFVTSHLLSANGSGRWQFWAAAVDEFRSSPLHGRGAGSYEAWWAQHGTLGVFIRNAHSFYLQTLGELGVVGLVLLVAALGLALLVGLRRTVGRSSLAASAVVAAAAAFLVSAGIDWVWELPAVGAVGLLCLGLVSGAAGARERTAAARVERFARVAVAVVAVLAIAVQAPALLSQLRLHASQAAAAAGNLQQAADAAERARALEPWAASPYVQLALVREQAGDLAAADESIARATDRDPSDWRSWLVRARIEVEAGRIPAARHSLAQAKELDPRSPLFRNLTDS